MRLLLITLIAASGVFAQTWTLQSHQASTANCGGSGNCNIPMTVTAGRIGIIVFTDSGSGGVQPTITDNGSNTWTIPAACKYSDTNGLTTCAYNLNIGSNATTITFNSANFVSGDFNYYEYTHSGGTPAFDTAGSGASVGSGSSGPGITLSGLTGNDVIVQAVGDANNIIVTAVSAAYGNILIDPGTGGTRIASADRQNTNSGTAPTWTESVAGSGVAVAIALTLGSGGGGVTPAAYKLKKLTRLD